ncbi:MAG TPA: DUF3300 domain-containing protein [Phycisphaerales bacterium]|nr:DUF3300 domain-containing protein [Phycisphaerales bacterium]
MKPRTLIALLLAAPLTAAPVAGQQQPAPPPAPAESALPRATAEQLDLLVAPIALYPDPLIAQVLPASTYPIDIIKAARLVAAGATDAKIDQQDWDSSVKAVARYPDVIKMMDADIEWTQQLGQAFIVQPDDVMRAVQRMRARAIEMGSLTDTPQQQIVYEEETVRILPADPQIVYVPIYQPILVYYRRPVYRTSFISFSRGYHCGPWLDLDCDWRRRWCYRPGWTWNHWRENVVVRGGRVVSVRRSFDDHVHHHRPPTEWRRNQAKPLTLPGRKLESPAEFNKTRARDLDGRLFVEPATPPRVTDRSQPLNRPPTALPKPMREPTPPDRAVTKPVPQPQARPPVTVPAPLPRPIKPVEAQQPKPARTPITTPPPASKPQPAPQRNYTLPSAPKVPPVTRTPPSRPAAPPPRASPPPKPPEPAREPKRA